jgi:hypothetical protein
MAEFYARPRQDGPVSRCPAPSEIERVVFRRDLI